MADKTTTPPTIREDIVPNGDVLLQLQQPYTAETTASPGKEAEPSAAEKDAPKTKQTVELVVSSSTLRLVSTVFGELLDKKAAGKPSNHVAPDSHGRNDSITSNDSVQSLASPADTASLTPLSSPMAIQVAKKKKKKKLGLWGEVIGEEGADTSDNTRDTTAPPSTQPQAGDQSPVPAPSPSTPPPPSHAYILVLPEDDASAMTLFMRHVHFRLGDPCLVGGDGIHGGLPNPELLEKLAYVCSKYKCVHTLQAIGDSWVSRNMERLDKEEDTTEVARLAALCRLLVFAYVADQAQAFTDLCWQIVMYNTGPISGGLSSKRSSILTLVRLVSNQTPSVPERILGKHPLLLRDVPVALEARRFASCNRFHQALMDSLGEMVSIERKGFKPVHKYMEGIQDSGLLIRDVSFPDYSIKGLLDKTRLSLYTSGFFTKLNSKKDTILGPRDSLTCLDCIHTAGESHKTHKCRVSHS